MKKDYRLLTTLLAIVICVIVVIAIAYLVKNLYDQKKSLINSGCQDDEAKRDYYLDSKKKNGKAKKRISLIFELVLASIFVFAFSSSIYIQAVNNNEPVSGLMMPRLVASGSMSYKNPENKYLEQNDLNNQFKVFDIVFIEKLPDEFELKKYDIVVYEYEEQLIIHRIINIEEPNSKHPEHRLFQLKGDANKGADKSMVKYEQMKGIYLDKKIPFLGIFVAFFQSVFGGLCFVVALGYILITPKLEKNIFELEKERLLKIGFIDSDGLIVDADYVYLSDKDFKKFLKDKKKTE